MENIELPFPYACIKHYYLKGRKVREGKGKTKENNLTMLGAKHLSYAAS